VLSMTHPVWVSAQPFGALLDLRYDSGRSARGSELTSFRVGNKWRRTREVGTNWGHARSAQTVEPQDRLGLGVDSLRPPTIKAGPLE